MYPITATPYLEIFQEVMRWLLLIFFLQAFLDLYVVAAKHGDLLEGIFLEEKVETIKMIGDHVTNLKRVGPGLGEFRFDKHLERNSS